MGILAQPLLEFLQSICAALNLPFPDISERSLGAMRDIAVMQKRIDEHDTQASSQICSQGTSQSRRMPIASLFHDRQMWNELQTTLDSGLLEVLMAQHVFAKYPGNRWLQICGPQLQSQGVKSAPSTDSTPRFVVYKVECLYRTNWNKKCPLGVSNVMHAREFVTPGKFSQTVLGGSDFFSDSAVEDALWTLRQNCAEIQEAVEHYLGSTCPLHGMEQVSNSEPVDVLRTVSLLDHATSPHRVATTVVRVFLKILPSTLWDTTRWESLIRHYVVGLTRFESLDLPNRTVAFVFRKVIVPLISYMFYATDASGGDTGEIYYFRRPLWDLATSRASLGLVELLSLRACADSNLAGAKVRWAPKKSGMRPIVVQPPFLKEKTRKLLLYLNAVRQDKLGCSVLTRAECHKHLVEFVNDQEQSSDDLFYLSADIQNCFESIPFKPLSEALASLAPEGTKFSSAVVTTFRMLGSVPPRKRAIVFLDAKNLLAQIPGSSDPDNPTIIHIHKESVSEENLNYQTVQSEIFRILTSSVYRLSTGGSTTTTAKYKVTTRGLPQGLSLSVMLVSIFYGWLDSQWSRPAGTVMVRLVDDILCLCRSESQLAHLHNHVVDRQVYGVVNQAKLEFGRFGASGSSSMLSWAGFQLRPNGTKLNVRTFNEKSGKPPRKFRDLDSYFRNFLVRSLAQNALPILFCATLNTPENSNANAFRIGAMAARRVALFLRCGVQISEPEFRKFSKKLDRFIKRRFGENTTLLKQFRFAFEKTLRSRS